MKFLFIFLGGGFGSLFRYWISILLHDKTALSGWWSTFLVNAIGSFLLGILVGYFIKNENDQEVFGLMLTVGFCGGFTTFSTFSLDVINMLRTGLLFQAGVYVFLSLVVSFILLFLGWKCIA